MMMMIYASLTATYCYRLYSAGKRVECIYGYYSEFPLGRCRQIIITHSRVCGWRMNKSSVD